MNICSLKPIWPCTPSTTNQKILTNHTSLLATWMTIRHTPNSSIHVRRQHRRGHQNVTTNYYLFSWQLYLPKWPIMTWSLNYYLFFSIYLSKDDQMVFDGKVVLIPVGQIYARWKYIWPTTPSNTNWKFLKNHPLLLVPVRPLKTYQTIPPASKRDIRVAIWMSE